MVIIRVCRSYGAHFNAFSNFSKGVKNVLHLCAPQNNVLTNLNGSWTIAKTKSRCLASMATRHVVNHDLATAGGHISEVRSSRDSTCILKNSSTKCLVPLQVRCLSSCHQRIFNSQHFMHKLNNVLPSFQLDHVNYAVRHYGSKRDKKSKKRGYQDDDDESDSEEEIDLSGLEETEHHDEDKDFPKNFRTLKANVKSLRVDTILAAGLNISRSKIEDYFLASKLRVNGEKCLKKSKKVGPGDGLDLIMETGENSMKVKRVRILAVSDAQTKSERSVVLLKAWRSAVPIENQKRDFGKKSE